MSPAFNPIVLAVATALDLISIISGLTTVISIILFRFRAHDTVAYRSIWIRMSFWLGLTNVLYRGTSYLAKHPSIMMWLAKSETLTRLLFWIFQLCPVMFILLVCTLAYDLQALISVRSTNPSPLAVTTAGTATTAIYFSVDSVDRAKLERVVGRQRYYLPIAMLTSICVTIAALFAPEVQYIPEQRAFVYSFSNNLLFRIICSDMWLIGGLLFCALTVGRTGYHLITGNKGSNDNNAPQQLLFDCHSQSSAQSSTIKLHDISPFSPISPISPLPPPIGITRAYSAPVSANWSSDSVTLDVTEHSAIRSSSAPANSTWPSTDDIDGVYDGPSKEEKTAAANEQLRQQAQFIKTRIFDTNSYKSTIARLMLNPVIPLLTQTLVVASRYYVPPSWEDGEAPEFTVFHAATIMASSQGFLTFIAFLVNPLL
ncbi:hypothetical protein GQ42DRAFT_154076 [Ramicandelaber brevisporus]|nr:hypothetical protein GQ42DRAFT_154076 [Ramicandelaber brevisporus]